jgi:hypothetical protein
VTAQELRDITDALVMATDTLRRRDAELAAYHVCVVRVLGVVADAVGRGELETADALMDAVTDLRARMGEFVISEENE